MSVSSLGVFCLCMLTQVCLFFVCRLVVRSYYTHLSLFMMFDAKNDENKNF